MERSTAEGIFADWEEFARYGFNKSHAADYGVIAVQTAYLKANYPAEYMAALLSASAGDTEKVALYAADARSLGVPVLPPDINCLGLGLRDRGRGWQASDPLWPGRHQEPGSRGHGAGACRTARQRALQGSERLCAPGRSAGPRKAWAGVPDQSRGTGFVSAGDSHCWPRWNASAGMSANHFRAIESGQTEPVRRDDRRGGELTLPAVGNPDKREMLNWERELIGLYVSDHPLTPHQPALSKIVSALLGPAGRGAARGSRAGCRPDDNGPPLCHQGRKADGIRDHRGHPGQHRAGAVPADLGEGTRATHARIRSSSWTARSTRATRRPRSWWTRSGPTSRRPMQSRAGQARRRPRAPLAQRRPADSEDTRPSRVPAEAPNQVPPSPRTDERSGPLGSRGDRVRRNAGRPVQDPSGVARPRSGRMTRCRLRPTISLPTGRRSGSHPSTHAPWRVRQTYPVRPSHQQGRVGRPSQGGGEHSAASCDHRLEGHARHLCSADHHACRASQSACYARRSDPAIPVRIGGGGEGRSRPPAQADHRQASIHRGQGTRPTSHQDHLRDADLLPREGSFQLPHLRGRPRRAAGLSRARRRASAPRCWSGCRSSRARRAGPWTRSRSSRGPSTMAGIRNDSASAPG